MLITGYEDMYVMLIAVVTVLIKICELSIVDPFCRLQFTAELLH